MEPWQHQFRNALADGDMCASEGDWETAISFYKGAFRLIPEPKDIHEEATAAITAFGDCYLKQGDYEKAEQAFRDVLLFPGAPADPSIRLRRAEVYFFLGDEARARTEVTVAYLNGGKEDLALEGVDPAIHEIVTDVIRELA